MATKPNDDSSLSHMRWNWKYHIVFIPISPKLAVSLFMGYLKGKNSLMIFAIHANLKYKYGNRNFWPSWNVKNISNDKSIIGLWRYGTIKSGNIAWVWPHTLHLTRNILI